MNPMPHGMYDSRRVPDTRGGYASYLTKTVSEILASLASYTMDSMEHRAWMLDVYHGAWLMLSLRSILQASIV